MRQAEEAELTATSADTGQDYTDKLDGDRLGGRRESYHEHTGCGQRDEYKDSRSIGDSVDEVRSDQLGKERRDDIGEEDNPFRQRANKVLGGGEDDHVKDIVDEA